MFDGRNSMVCLVANVRNDSDCLEKIVRKWLVDEVFNEFTSVDFDLNVEHKKQSMQGNNQHLVFLEWQAAECREQNVASFVSSYLWDEFENLEIHSNLVNSIAKSYSFD